MHMNRSGNGIGCEKAMKHLYHLHPRKEVRHFACEGQKGSGNERREGEKERERNQREIAARKVGVRGGSVVLCVSGQISAAAPELKGRSRQD